ncbi:MAG: sigma-70 family RNA polymerase sigma factor, partial [Planctomycetota bacterium]
LRLADSIGRWDPARPFLAWARVATLNACRNHLRASDRRTAHEESAGRLRAVRSAPSPSAATEASEATELLNRALGLLPPREREVFVLVDLEGLNSVEAAEVCEVTPSTVRAALAQARRRLRSALDPELGAVPNQEEDCHDSRI